MDSANNMTVLDCVEAVMKYLERSASQWIKISERGIMTALSDEQVERAMGGHSMWDDPPPGWTKPTLLLWSRGYLHAESVHLGNAAAVIHASMDLEFGLKHIVAMLRRDRQGERKTGLTG